MAELSVLDPRHSYRPLDELRIAARGGVTIVATDGRFRDYARCSAGPEATITLGGAPGHQQLRLVDRDGRAVASATVLVQVETRIDDDGGAFASLLDMLRWTMGESDRGRYEGRTYHYFVCWLRDHVHTLKGMKYFYPELESGIDLYAVTQRDDGMIWDNYYRRTPEMNFWDVIFTPGGFIRPVEDGTRELKRIPVENDVEYLFLEGIYYTWKATGDDAWMASMLDRALKALHYSTHDRYRWSEKHRLLKRGYTIDTWDFQAEEDAEITGHPMVIDPDRTRFGIMHGDNTGMAASCGYLAEMLAHAGRGDEAQRVREVERGLRERLDAIAWNGAFFTHHVPEDPSVRRDLGVDGSRQVSLSNAYALNRGIAHEQAVAIIRSYQRIRDEMPASSPGEFYQIYPPYGAGFGNHNEQWHYMNGGVTSIVAGELAHGAFEHGFEGYGADILRRVKGWGDRHRGYIDCCLRGAMPEPPQRNFTELDLAPLANTDFSGQGGDGVPGWTGEGGNDLHEMPVGRQIFEDVPFLIADPGRNGRRGCIGISTKAGYAREMRVPVGTKARSLYLVHTLAGGGPAGTLALRYDDGTQHLVYIQPGVHLNGWWMPAITVPRNRLPTAKVAWRGANERIANVGAFIMGLDNPQPDKRIEAIELRAAENGSLWFVIGATLCDTPVFFMPDERSFGIPDNWGAAAVVYALVEGLAGVKDEGVAFDRALVAPRWAAADVARADATIAYPASHTYVGYRYRRERDEIHLRCTGSGEDVRVEILLPDGREAAAVTVDGAAVAWQAKTVEASRYACCALAGVGIHHVVVRLR